MRFCDPKCKKSALLAYKTQFSRRFLAKFQIFSLKNLQIIMQPLIFAISNKNREH